MSWTARIFGWIDEDQLTAATWDGDPNPGGENSQDNCGETMAAAFVLRTTGVWIPPDSVKDSPYFLGQGALGYANEKMISRFLSQNCHIPNTIYYPTSLGDAMGLQRQYNRNDLGMIVLRYSYKSADGIGIGGHWNGLIGGDGADDYHTAHCITSDPYGAFERTETNTDFWSWMKPYPTWTQRCLIGIDRPRDPNL